jgi:hypothetical protein
VDVLAIERRHERAVQPLNEFRGSGSRICARPP